jgi:hypothetical protein
MNLDAYIKTNKKLFKNTKIVLCEKFSKIILN